MDVSSDAGGIVEVNDTALSSYPAVSTFENNSFVYLEAIPASGFRFENWNGDLSGNANPTTIMMDCSKKITANFSRTMNTLSMRVDGNGSTTPAAGNNSYEEGTVVSITATPDSGWRFNGWTGDVAEPDMAITTVTIDSNKTVIASFSRIILNWWLAEGITGGVAIIGVVLWLAIRSRAS